MKVFTSYAEWDETPIKWIIMMVRCTQADAAYLEDVEAGDTLRIEIIRRSGFLANYGNRTREYREEIETITGYRRLDKLLIHLNELGYKYKVISEDMNYQLFTNIEDWENLEDYRTKSKYREKRDEDNDPYFGGFFL